MSISSTIYVLIVLFFALSILAVIVIKQPFLLYVCLPLTVILIFARIVRGDD
ncbi:MAG TPA: hypothetical protein VKR32_14840 [Puia sp.]|nr:hypothetical protein [Puia sp.]